MNSIRSSYPTQVQPSCAVPPESMTADERLDEVVHALGRGRKTAADVAENVAWAKPYETFSIFKRRAALGETPREDFIPYVADFFLQLEDVKWTVLGDCVRDTIPIGATRERKHA